jgi:signal transduction histidine kinase
VNQLNRGVDLITLDDERELLAELNLLAGRRARGSAAYASALKYLALGADLLPKSAWEHRHDLIFALELLRAECEFLTGELAGSESRLTMLSQRACGTIEQAAVVCSRMDLYTTLDQASRALTIGLESLHHLGIDWSPHPTDEEARREYARVCSQLGSRTIEELIDLPLMTDPASLATLDVLIKLRPAAMFTDVNILSLAMCRAVNLSIERGNSDGSCTAYVRLGAIAGSRFGDHQTALRFGRLGYELVARRGLNRFQARTYLLFGSLILPWTQHVMSAREVLHRAYLSATESGDLAFAAASAGHLNANMLATGDPLVDVQREAERGLEFARKIRFGLASDVIATQLQLVRMLRGKTRDFGSFDDQHFSELQTTRRFSDSPNLGYAECFFWIRKLQAYVLAGDYEAAVDASLRPRHLFWTAQSALAMAEYCFYAAIARAACCDCAGPVQYQQHRHALAAHYREIEISAQHCPENFANRAALVAAEIARIEKRDADALRLYEEAIRSARDNGFVQNEALAHELAAQCCLARRLETAGYAHLRAARNCYERWGAYGKVLQLDERYAGLREGQNLAASVTIRPPVGELDVETVGRASQALSSEMVLPILIEKLVRIAVENAGAERGLLVMERDGEPRIEAEATTGSGRIEVAVRQAVVTSSDLPQAALHYVIRTQKRVPLDDASADKLFSKDEYVRRKRCWSVLCQPIVKQAKLIGALYLENNLTPGAFTPDRVTVLQLLASQAAISLENAYLYANLELQAGLLQRLPVSAWTLKPDGTPDFVNQVWLEYSGQTLDFVRSHPEAWMTALHPEDREAASAALWEGVRSGQRFTIESRSLRAKDASCRWHLQQAVVLRDGEGKVLKFIGTTTDIDDQRRIEDALRQAQGALARINRVTTMGELAASLAHELSQPISGVMTNANTCLRKLGHDKPDPDALRSAVTRITRDAQRATEIIGRIRSQFQRGALNREIIDVNEINRETIALLRDETLRYKISVRTALAADLPQIVGDRVQLQQVAMNLIVYSIEAMKDVDGIREMVIKSQRVENEWILVSLSDTGIGFPAQLAEKIFDPFFTTKPRRTGMGLRISRSIIESHGGRLWAVGSAGRGATFHLSLPAARIVAQSPTTGNAEVRD